MKNWAGEEIPDRAMMNCFFCEECKTYSQVRCGAVCGGCARLAEFKRQIPFSKPEPGVLGVLVDCVIYSPTGEKKSTFGPGEHFADVDGEIRYFVNATHWEYADRDPRPIYKRVTLNALLGEDKGDATRR